jgi:hypothetical protein
LQFRIIGSFRATGKIREGFKEEGNIAFANAAEKTAKGKKVFQTSKNTICNLISTFIGRDNKSFLSMTAGSTK